MVIKNLTGKLQYLWIKNLLGGRSVSVQVLPNGSRELAHIYIPDRSMMANFDEIFEIVGATKSTVSEVTAHAVEEPTQESAVEEEAQEIIEDTIEESEAVETAPEMNESKFICQECGAEFGSSRGLASHQSRAHAQS